MVTTRIPFTSSQLEQSEKIGAVKLYPTEFDTLFTSLRNIYPSKFTTNTPDEPYRVAKEVYQFAMTKPEEFHQDLMTIGRTSDTVNILKSFGANDEQVNQIFGWSYEKAKLHTEEGMNYKELITTYPTWAEAEKALLEPDEKFERFLGGENKDQDQIRIVKRKTPSLLEQIYQAQTGEIPETLPEPFKAWMKGGEETIKVFTTPIPKIGLSISDIAGIIAIVYGGYQAGVQLWNRYGAYRMLPEYKAINTYAQEHNIPKSSPAYKDAVDAIRFAFNAYKGGNTEVANGIMREFYTKYNNTAMEWGSANNATQQVTALMQSIIPTATQTGAMAFGGISPTINATTWVAMSIADKVALVTSAGLEGKVASKPFEVLTQAEISAISKVIPATPVTPEVTREFIIDTHSPMGQPYKTIIQFQPSENAEANRIMGEIRDKFAQLNNEQQSLAKSVFTQIQGEKRPYMGFYEKSMAELNLINDYMDRIPTGKFDIRQLLSDAEKIKTELAIPKAEVGMPARTIPTVPQGARITQAQQNEYTKQMTPYLNKADMEIKRVNDEFMAGKTSLAENQAQRDAINAELDKQADKIRAEMEFPKPEAVTPTTPAVETTAIPEIPTISEVPPPEPPKTVSPDNPIVPPPQTPKEIDRVIEYSQKAYEVNAPRSLTRLMYKVPGLKQVLKLWRPNLQAIGNKETEKLYVAMIAEGEARFNVATWALPSRLEVFKQIKSVFGRETLHGGKVDIGFLGTPTQAKNPITGTLKDIADNPDLYMLNTKQKEFLTFLNDRNDKLLDWVNDGYDAEIGKFVPKEGGAYLPNVDIGEDIVDSIGGETRAVISGRGKTRIWQTARDRMAGKTPFKPELDVVKLINGLDSFKSSVAGAQSYKKVLGGLTRLEAMEKTHPELYNKMMALRKELSSLQGSAGTIESNVHKAIADFLESPVEDTDLATLRDNLDVKLKSGPRVLFNVKDVQDEIAKVREQIKTIRPAWEVANLKPYVFVQEGIYRYFNGDVANMIKESRMTTKNPVLRFADNWRAGAFSGDLSPFGQQGVIGVLADPIGSVKTGIGAVQSATQRNDFLYAVKVDALAEDIAKSPEDWARYASLMGRQLTGTPKEYAAGFLSKIPGFDKFTEATYVTVTRQSFDLWKRSYKNLIKHGMDEVTAQVVAAKDASEVYPLYNPTLLGQSEKIASYIRALPTSISFIVKPATLIEDGMIGMAKATTFGKVPLSPKESLALKRLITIAASVLITSAVSAYLSSKAKGESDEDALQAMLDAVNPDPNNGKFASIIIGNVRIPLGGPYRAIFRAIYPKKVSGVPFPVPFAGLYSYLENRINPMLSTQIDLIANKDYFGKAIISGDLPESILRGLEYEVENVLPLTAGSVMEDIRTGKTPQIRQDVISQFMGVNAVNVDDTYFKKLIRQLGLPDPDYVPIPNSINIAPDYTTKNLWGDTTKYIRKIDPSGLKWYPELIQEIAKALPLYDEMKLIPNTKLVGINADPDKGDTFEQYYQQWQDRQKDPEAYDKKYPDNKAYLGNMTQAQYALLGQYHDLEREGDKVRFLRDHPEINVNPRDEWLKSHPKENAILAIWGQADAKTLDSYNNATKTIDTLGIPDSAIDRSREGQLPPDSIAEEYYAYITKLAEGRVNEAKALLYQNPELYKYIKGEPLPTRQAGGGGGPSTEFFK